MSKSIVALFDNIQDARQAEQQLLSCGFAKDNIQIHAHGYGDYRTETSSESEASDTHHGILQTIRDMFSGMLGPQNEDADHYAEAVRRGGSVMTVQVEEENRVEQAIQIMMQGGAVNIDQRVAQWRERGYQGFDASQQPYTPQQADEERRHVIPVINEQLEVGKREVDLGAVRIYTRTVETPVSETVNLREQHAKVTRHPVDREASPADLEAAREEAFEVHETEEKPVVSKTARVVEEVEIDTESTERKEMVKDSVRNTQVDVDRQPQQRI